MDKALGGCAFVWHLMVRRSGARQAWWAAPCPHSTVEMGGVQELGVRAWLSRFPETPFHSAPRGECALLNMGGYHCSFEHVLIGERSTAWLSPLAEDPRPVLMHVQQQSQRGHQLSSLAPWWQGQTPCLKTSSGPIHPAPHLIQSSPVDQLTTLCLFSPGQLLPGTGDPGTPLGQRPLPHGLGS